MLTHVDLFSGIGGFALAAKWAGFKTVIFCEKDEYCQAVLKKHWPDVPIVPEVEDFLSYWRIDQCGLRSKDKLIYETFKLLIEKKRREGFSLNVKTAKKRSLFLQALLKEAENSVIGSVVTNICEENLDQTQAGDSGCGERKIQIIKTEEDTKGGFATTWKKSTSGDAESLQEINIYARNVEKSQKAKINSGHTILKNGQNIQDLDSKFQTESRSVKNAIIKSIKGKKIDLLTAGIPCQPASIAGKRRGQADSRWLWPETFVAIQKFRPTWCLLENVCGILSLERGMVFEYLLIKLETQGYEVQPFIIPACAIDAKHRRDRVWIVGYARSEERNWLPNQRRKTMVEIRRTSQDVAHSSRQRWRGRSHGDEAGDGWALQIERSGSADKSKDVADGGRTRLSDGNAGKNSEGTYLQSAGKSSRRTWHKWPVEPDMGLLADGLSAGLAGWCEWPEEPKDVPRVAKGMPERVNKLKALGNAVVPPLVYEILRYIREIEDGNTII